MRRQRTVSQVSGHCTHDLACRTCCKCVDPLQKQNRILANKNAALLYEKEDYIKEIMRLNKELRQWEKREKELQNLEEVKRKLRRQIEAEVQQQRRADDIIIKDKLSSHKKEREQFQRDMEALNQELTTLKQHLFTAQEDARNQTTKVQKLEKELHHNREELNRNAEMLAQIKTRNGELERALLDKNEVINRLQQGLSTTEQNYLTEKSRKAEAELELLRSKQEIKAAADSIQNLKVDTAQKVACIQQLSQQNSKLDKLVLSLDSTIQSYGVLEGQLRTRILVSEDYALQKEMEVKQLQSDFYEALYRRSL